MVKMKADMTDSALFKHWMTERGKLSSSTIYVYWMVVEKFLQHDPIIDEPEDYNNFLIKYSIKKRNYHYYGALVKFINFKFGKIAEIKTKLIKTLIKPTLRYDIVRERKHLSDKKIFDLINTLQHSKHKIIAIIQTLTGVRAGDILRLKRGGISPEVYEGKEVLKLTLTGKRRKRNVVYIHDIIAKDIIINHITQNIYNVPDYYFLEKTDLVERKNKTYNEFQLVNMNYVPYWKDLKQSLSSNGIDLADFATHDFRRCFARKAWEKWKDISILQKLLNHRDPKTTLRYLEQSGMQNIDYLREMQG